MDNIEIKIKGLINDIINKQVKDVTLDYYNRTESAEFTREYKFDDPFMLPIMCRPNCCLFCDEYTDIYYDSRGPYAIVCLKSGNFEDGMLGKCPYQKEQEIESK